jgi:acyl-CoA synthetase (NDP forming)
MSAPPGAVEALKAAHVPLYDDIVDAVRALQRANRVAESLSRPPGSDHDVPVRRAGVEHALSEAGAHALLAGNLTIALPEEELVREPSEAPASAARLGFPLALKLQSTAMLHKTEHGAVLLGIDSADAACGGVQRLLGIAERLGIATEGVLMQRMVPHREEMILGLRTDRQVGPLLMIGRGGVDAEFERDVAIRFLPVSAEEIEEALHGLAMAHRFRGSRGRVGIDVPTLARVIAGLCTLYERRSEILELEINPLALSPPGDFVALDMLLKVAGEEIDA